MSLSREFRHESDAIHDTQMRGSIATQSGNFPDVLPVKPEPKKTCSCVTVCISISRYIFCMMCKTDILQIEPLDGWRAGYTEGFAGHFLMFLFLSRCVARVRNVG